MAVSEMFEIDRANCTACGACINACPRGALKWSNDDCGFYYPELNADLCVKCGLCEKVCPIDKETQFSSASSNPEGYAAYAPENNIRRNSSSGGVFSVLASRILEQNGVVYGAAYLENFQVSHIGVRSMDDLVRLRGSKYVQSFIPENLFKEVKQELEKGTAVLFSGTPCLNAGLKTFLQKEYANLITVDLVCHGVPPQTVFDGHIKACEKRYGRKLVSYNFRDKEKSWHYFNTLLTWDDGTTTSMPFLKSPYMKLFLHDGQPFLRQSCYRCKYAKKLRCSDITIGDFWGYQQTATMPNTDEGISCVLCNTEKGKSFYREISGNLTSEARRVDEVARSNYTFSHPTYYSEQAREHFWSVFKQHGFEKAEMEFSNSKKQLLIIFLDVHFPWALALLVSGKHLLKKLKSLLRR